MDTQEKIIAEMREWRSGRDNSPPPCVTDWADRLAALPKAEPVAWLCDGPHGRTAHVSRIKILPEAGCAWSPLYTAPPAPVVSDENRGREIQKEYELMDANAAVRMHPFPGDEK